MQLTHTYCENMPADLLPTIDNDKGVPVVTGQSKLKAVLAKFDSEGHDISQAITEQLSEERLDWSVWSEDARLKDWMTTESMRADAFSAYWQMWSSMPQPPRLELVKPVINNELSTKWMVRAGKDIEVGQLVLIPYLGSPHRLQVKKCVHPDAIVVTVQAMTMTSVADTRTYWANPDTTCDISFTANACPKGPSLFWACKRSSRESECNCEVQEMRSHIVTCSEWNGLSGSELPPEAASTRVQIPVIVNTTKILTGSYLVVKCEPPAPKVVVKSAKRAKTWEDDAKRTIKRSIR